MNIIKRSAAKMYIWYLANNIIPIINAVNTTKISIANPMAVNIFFILLRGLIVFKVFPFGDVIYKFKVFVLEPQGIIIHMR